MISLPLEKSTNKQINVNDMKKQVSQKHDFLIHHWVSLLLYDLYCHLLSFASSMVLPIPLCFKSFQSKSFLASAT